MTTITIDTSIAAWLSTQLLELLRLPTLPKSDVSPSALGLTSLAAVTLQYRLIRDHQLTLTLDELMGSSSLASLAQQAQSRDLA
ncbi:hypothetical protein AAKU61_003817 [Undibacterium sp. GrIS 1.2]